MTARKINTRIVHKHATEANWKKAINFVPLLGEFIVYDPDETFLCARFKIGDGVSNVNDLPFADGFGDTVIFDAGSIS